MLGANNKIIRGATRFRRKSALTRTNIRIADNGACRRSLLAQRFRFALGSPFTQLRVPHSHRRRLSVTRSEELLLSLIGLYGNCITFLAVCQ